jgi:hypothetical protein
MLQLRYNITQRNRSVMLSLSTNSSIDLSQLANSCIDFSHLVPQPRRSPFSSRGRGQRKRTTRIHSWTDEELDLLSYLRHLRYWRFKQIKETYFPSLSLGALSRAYWRLSPEDRIRRASVISTQITNLRNATEYSRNTLNNQLRPHNSEQELNPSCSESYTENDTETSISSLPTPGSTGRYNLRQNRPTTFLQRDSRYLVDSARFPHFYKSYKYHLESSGLPDEDYYPPSQTPTPESFDRSPSVISTQLSEASSLDLFGLEPCSIKSSSRDPSINSNSPIDTSSPEFFSAEEHLPSP